jgi:hypothetical protein
MDGDDRLCFVTPARNQAGHLRPLFCAVARRMQGLGLAWDIVFVDDGSDDGSPEVLRTLAAEDSRVRVVRLSRQFGLEAAVAAGLAHCDGAAAVVIDAALEHPAHMIPAMLAAWREGAKVVRPGYSPGYSPGYTPGCTPGYTPGCKSRGSRNSEPFAIGLLDREVVAALAAIPQGERCLADSLDWLGYQPTTLGCPPVKRRAEDAVSQNLTVRARREGARRPSALSGLATLGLTAAVAGLIVWVTALSGVGLFAAELASAAATSAALVFLSGVQLAGVGMAVRHARRSPGEVAGQPYYVAVERIGFDRPRAVSEPEPAILRFSSAERRRHHQPVLRARMYT